MRVKRSAGADFSTFRLERQSPIPVYKQLYEQVRMAILTGRFSAGCRLPSSRALAQQLCLSRNTVVVAFDQLYAEGYIDGKGGSGTYVAWVLPDDLTVSPPTTSEASPAAEAQVPERNRLSRQSKMLAPLSSVFLPVLDVQNKFPGQAFQIGASEINAFPRDIWERLLLHRWRHSWHGLLNYHHPAGYRPLREAIAGYLGTARGVHCTAEQVIVVTGSQQAIALTARVLIDPGDSVWMEEPGYLGARAALMGMGAQLIPVPVDQEGIHVDAGQERCPHARLAFVTPSHQFPLGVTMSLARRLALLDWAYRSGAWVLEDDYDSEFRYASRPLAALQGLDTKERVIYSGTFSKVLFPGLRLGYLVVPPDLVEAFTAARLFADMHSPVLEQAALADFIAEGHFARHIRRMRFLYAQRQATLVESAGGALRGLLDVSPAEAGMHLVGWLAEGVDDCEAAMRAAIEGVSAVPLSHYALETPARGALLLGYASVEDKEIVRGVEKLAIALQPKGR